MHWLNYLPFAGLYRLVVFLPQSWVVPIAGALARLTVTLGFGKGIVRRNLESAFGEQMSRAEREKLYRDNMRATWLTALELMWMTKHDRDWVRKRARISGWEHVERAREQGRGALLLCG